MIVILRKFMAMFKIVGYIGFAFVTYLNFIGPNGVVELLGVDKPSEEGIEMIAILIPKQLLWWGLAVIILEIVDNLLAVFEPVKHK